MNDGLIKIQGQTVISETTVANILEWKSFFGASVKARRMQLAFTQEQLADRANLHRTYISDIERGERNLSLDNIVKLAHALDVSVADLFLHKGKAATCRRQ